MSPDFRMDYIHGAIGHLHPDLQISYGQLDIRSSWASTMGKYFWWLPAPLYREADTRLTRFARTRVNWSAVSADSLS